MFEKCFITTAGMIETTRATNVYHKYLSQMWENVQHHDDTDTLSQYHENGKFPKTWQLLVLAFFYKSTRTSSPNHDRSTSKWKCALSEVLFLLATKLIIVSLSLSMSTLRRNHFHFLRSRTNTVPSLALAPTLSPLLFQHTCNVEKVTTSQI